jgi:hypothetical protein
VWGQARATCWAEAVQYTYNDFDDYSATVMQFCFVLFFAEVFPLAPLIALVNNVILLRVKVRPSPPYLLPRASSLAARWQRR